MCARRIHLRQVDSRDQDLLLVRRGSRDDFSRSPGDKALAPKLDAVAGELFMADAVGDGQVTAVGDSVAALDCFPRIMLASAVFGFFGRMPADRGWIE